MLWYPVDWFVIILHNRLNIPAISGLSAVEAVPCFSQRNDTTYLCTEYESKLDQDLSVKGFENAKARLSSARNSNINRTLSWNHQSLCGQ